MPKPASAPAKGIYLRGRTYWLRFTANGKQQFVSLQTSEPAQAIANAEKVRTAQEFKPQSAILADAQRFITSRKNAGKFTSRKTEEWAMVALRSLNAYFPGRATGSLRHADLEQYAQFLRKTHRETGVMSYLRAISSFCSWAVREHLFFESPTKGLVRRPKHFARVRFATKAQRDAVIASCARDDMKFVFYCAFHAGMRREEIGEARPDWFDLDGGFITIQETDTFVPKNKRARTVPLSQAFKEFLSTYGLRAPFMVAPEVEHGRAHYRWDFRRPWRDHLKAQKLPWITPHVARHTFASLLVQKGVSLYKVAKWLGDSLKVCEDHYAHLEPGDSEIDVL